MPHDATLLQLPCGERVRRLEVSGVLTSEEVMTLLDELKPGGPLHGLPLLILLQRLAPLSPEVRRTVGQIGLEEVETWEALVVNNPVVRVTINFVMRIQGRKKTKLFSGEREAIQWLDARVREDMAAKPGAP